ncbi:hypothetical protein MHZ92_12240 [Sporosarcina sp. ACRSL]|uniref:hypothetical protein n=1 Tax=Sporosarcina sp. ACRSL TaxID=2918215 RepID=UPI001EF7217F|nr:hypothetical protein [Sporosarcina sp. ACRSL]MCG7344908.1 hypothetical protein [Sporosarcina sp. ACRSL]
MKVIVDLLFLLVFGYLCYRFFRLAIKMKQPAVFPITEEDLKAIRTQPQKAVNKPLLSHQKIGLLMMGLTLLFLLIVVIFILLDSTIQTSYFIIPLLTLLNFNQFWNLFAIVEDGVLCGGRFVQWKSIQSFQFEPIDTNHRFYGYAPEVNSGHELKIKTKFTEVSCIVTSEAVKEKLTGLLENHAWVDSENSERYNEVKRRER